MRRRLKGWTFWGAKKGEGRALGLVLPVFHFQSRGLDPNSGRIHCFAQNISTKPEYGLLEKIKESLIQKEVGTDYEYGCKCLRSHNQAEREERVCSV